jgi:hypothetical protein
MLGRAGFLESLAWAITDWVAARTVTANKKRRICMIQARWLLVSVYDMDDERAIINESGQDCQWYPGTDVEFYGLVYDGKSQHIFAGTSQTGRRCRIIWKV